MGKREDILQATLDLVVEEGLASFSFSKLFVRARVGSGTVYHYFEGKDALLEALYIDVAVRLDRGVFAQWSPDLPLRAQFEAIFRGFARFAMAHPKEVAFIETCSRTPAIPRELRERVTPAQEVGMRLMERCQAEGLLRPMSPHLALAIASGMVASVVGAAGSGKYTFGDAELDILIESSWRALATDATVDAESTRN